MKMIMPIGVDDFKKAREDYYFVDKTSFISDFFQTHSEVTLITRPRRFGKTLTLSMLRYFFDIEGADEHRKLFDGLAISRDAAMMAEMGTRPVLFLTLRGWKALDWPSMQAMIANGLQQVAREQVILRESSRVDEEDRNMLQAMYRSEAPFEKLKTALAMLLRMLEAQYGKQPILLLDEYDVPIQSAWEHGFYMEAIDFFRTFLTTALKTNPSLDFAVLTGVLRISKESIFSDLNNLSVDSVLQMKYPTALGFTPEEVQKLAADLGHADKMAELRTWYDGYRFDGHEIYNPWSVLNYFAYGCEPAAYWVNTSGNAVIAELMKSADREHFERLETLQQGGTVQGYLREGVIYDDIGKDEDALYTMLCTTGYLTIAGIRRLGTERQYTLRLPNLEMQALLSIEIVKRYQNGYSKSMLVRLMDWMFDGDVERLEDGLGSYLERVASTFDTAKGKEAFYHGFILGLTAVLVPDYEVRSNRESGYGRYDVAILPKAKGQPGVVMELKIAESEDELAAKAEEALAQIQTHDYANELKAREANPLRCFGMAFCGKTACVRMA
ncbi:MAG: ATP-binding protein [Selenomonas sp.]|uniref:AAA family ATPase n=1 Tax=Selenomonas sp. TaxID=2053611 RepID=UPI0025DD94C7|nr:AAA family ATPase [Selenomonas sp.]MCI6084765.1 ATP-binding protein [Selenomonas sp.]